MLIVPIIKSAIKRVEVNERQKQENRGPKSQLANALKKYRSLLSAGKVEEAEKFLPELVSLVDTSAKKGIITKENANRKKANIAVALEKAKSAK